MNSSLTLFELILKGEIPAQKVFEDEFTFAFHDVAPQAPVHVLIIPKTKIKNISEANAEHAEILGKILVTAGHVAKLLEIEKSGYRLVFNNGSDAGQTVPYLHCHLLGGRTLHWPPG